MLVSKLPDVGTTIFSVMSALASEHHAINLSQGFPDYKPSPELLDALQRASKGIQHQYAPMPGLPQLTQAVAEKYRNVFSLDVQPSTQITITPGGTPALFAAIASVVKTGDEVIYFPPAYDSYEPAVRILGGIAIPSPLPAPTYTPDWDHVRSCITPKTVLIIINSPHNPTGAVWQESDYLELERICEEHNILVVSDEVYELITFNGIQPQSVLLYPALRDRSFVVTSFGKTFHITGWKVGCCVASEELTKEFRKVHQFLTFSTNTPAQIALAEYMTSNSSYLELGSFFQQKRDTFLKAIEGSLFTVRPCNGSYFQLLDYSGFSKEKDTDLAIRLTKEIGVASIPLSPFFKDSTDTALRFCFAKEDATLIAAGERLKQIRI